MQIDTTSPAYQNLLSAIITIHNQLSNNYRPVLVRMTKAQLIQLYQRDPIFHECILLAKDLNKLADKVGVDL